MTLVLVQFGEFQRKLPEFHQFFGPSNWFYLAIAMGFTKVLHEFGHGLSCKHFGGECHELGVMLLVLTPCLYCNVSDSWMLPNKWHRAFIGAAGMYVEICIASIATFLWWFSAPGLLNNICLSTMFVCSVSTVVFNGNPLLRYDGYYILVGRSGNSEPAAKSHDDSKPQAGLLVPGFGRARRSVFAAAQPGAVHALFGGGVDLQLGGDVFDFVFSV